MKAFSKEQDSIVSKDPEFWPRGPKTQSQNHDSAIFPPTKCEFHFIGVEEPVSPPASVTGISPLDFTICFWKLNWVKQGSASVDPELPQTPSASFALLAAWLWTNVSGWALEPPPPLHLPLPCCTDNPLPEHTFRVLWSWKQDTLLDSHQRPIALLCFCLDCRRIRKLMLPMAATWNAALVLVRWNKGKTDFCTQCFGDSMLTYFCPSVSLQWRNKNPVFLAHNQNNTDTCPNSADEATHWTPVSCFFCESSAWRNFFGTEAWASWIQESKTGNLFTASIETHGNFTHTWSAFKSVKITAREIPYALSASGRKFRPDGADCAQCRLWQSLAFLQEYSAALALWLFWFPTHCDKKSFSAAIVYSIWSSGTQKPEASPKLCKHV